MRRVVCRHLTHHLRADRARGPGYHHHLVVEKVGRRLHVYLYLLAREKVLNGHRMQLPDIEVLLSVPLACLGRHHDLDAGVHQRIEYILVLAQQAHLQRRDDERRYLLSLHEIR